MIFSGKVQPYYCSLQKVSQASHKIKLHIHFLHMGVNFSILTRHEKNATFHHLKMRSEIGSSAFQFLHSHGEGDTGISSPKSVTWRGERRSQLGRW